MSVRSRKFVTPLFEILRSFEVFISAKRCGSFNKFNTYFLRSLDRSLFFRKRILLQVALRIKGREAVIELRKKRMTLL